MSKFRIAISVGHGKKRQGLSLINDPGARNPNSDLSEFTVCKKYRKILIELLSYDKRFEFFAVTPNIPLDSRIRVINSLHKDKPFDLAIELHMNSYKRPEPNYAEIYHYATLHNGETISSIKGKKYGDAFLEAVISELQFGDGKNDGLSEPFGDEEWETHRYGFVKGCIPPALIIEPAFISNDMVSNGIILGGLIPSIGIACYRGLVACHGVHKYD